MKARELHRRIRRHARGMAAACAAALLLAACGGGGGSSGSDAPSSSGGTGQGSLSLGLTGGAATGYTHVYVTISSVAVTADADRPWSATDSAWHVTTLAEPLTIDLAALTDGAIAQLAIGQALPPGTYGQLRLFVVPHDAQLSVEAKQQGLSYNDEADLIDASGNTQRIPIEFADATLGLRVGGPFTVSANTDTAIVLQWDVDHSLVPLAPGSSARLAMRPDLQWYDVNQSGSITGLMDKSLFCASGVQAASCIYDAVASAELVSADGTHERAVRSAPVILSSDYAVFALYPLPPLADGQTYDVVIRGRNMRTMIVRQVPAPNDSPLVSSTPVNPTALGESPDPNNPGQSVPTPMQPQLSGGDASASLAQPMVTAGVQLRFAQTLPGSGEVPIEIAAANVDPLSGTLAQPQPLPTGALQVASYSATAALSFSDVTPLEGANGYSVLSLGPAYDMPSTAAPLTLTAGGSSSFTANVPAPQAGIGSGTLTVSLSNTGTHSYDAAELVVSDARGIVATQDISGLIATANAQATLTLPAGSAAAAVGGGAVYALGVRTWQRAAPGTSVQWARSGIAVDLRTNSTTSVTLALP